MSEPITLLLSIADRLNEVLLKKSKKEISAGVESLHNELAPIYTKLQFDEESSQLLKDLSMELLLDVRWGRKTKVSEKILSVK